MNSAKITGARASSATRLVKDPEWVHAVVVDSGEVGLGTALSLVEPGVVVTGVNIDENGLLVRKARGAEPATPEHARLEPALAHGRLELTSNVAAISDAEFVVIAVPMSAVGEDVYVAFSPEHVDPGVSGQERCATPRVVGGVTEECGRRTEAVIARGAPAVDTVTSPEAADVRESPALEIMAELAGLSYADPHVPTVCLGETALQSSDQVESQEWDLVIVHTVHPGCDPGWLGGQNAVLDTTYRVSPQLRCAHL
jgi:UDP-N-acetyl-D-mannosaminuronate dehydrogenase